jgi:ATP-dependent Clp protease ATP-binding subunit ClpC
MFTLLKTRKTRAILKATKEKDVESNSDINNSFLELFFSSEFVNKYSFLESIFQKNFKDLLSDDIVVLLNHFQKSKINHENFLIKAENWTNTKTANQKIYLLLKSRIDFNNKYYQNYLEKNPKFKYDTLVDEIKQLNIFVRNILIKNRKNSINLRTSYKQIKNKVNNQFPLILSTVQNLNTIPLKESVLKSAKEKNISDWEYENRIFVLLFVFDAIVKILLINLAKLSSIKKLPSSSNVLLDKTEKLIKIQKSDFFVGRESEINRIIQILSRRIKNNPILIGETGVGKSTILESLAIRLLKSIEFSQLSKNRILSINLELLIANSLFKKRFEKRLKNIISTIQENSQTILILDNIHILFGLNAKETSSEVNLLKIALSSNKIQCLGSTTAEEYKQFITKDVSLENYFQPLIIKEADILLTLQILQSIKKNYEDYHWVTYTPNAIKSAVNLSSQYITDRFLPDKAIDLIDEAGAYVKLKNLNIPTSAEIFYYELLEARKQKIKAVNLENYGLANNYLKKELELQSLVSGHIKSSQITKLAKPLLVSDIEIAMIIASWTGIPVNKISKAESQNLLQMEEILHQRIIGQHQAIVSVSKAIRRARVGLKNPNRPIASFIFAGPTGVGKTELTKALAFYFFGSESNMVRLDMSEYMERHTVAKLIGSPPGYIGYNEGGQLTEAVRQKPYTVVLFDEMEKAHPDIFNLLLQILEDGHLTDSKGRKIDFKNTLIILTSNVGARVIENSHKNNSVFNTGFNDKTKSVYKKIWQLVNQELKNQFKPEFLNRLDEIIVFSQLTLDDITQIAEIMIKQLIKRVQKQNGIHLTITDRVRHKVIKEGFNPMYGARPLRRAVMNLLEDNLATKFLTNELTTETKLIVDLDNSNKITLIIDKNIE